MSRAPNRFVGLHSHSTFSTYDAIGRPQDHIDFAIKNGSDALALTDHGNMNGFSHQYLHAKKLEAKGVPFKPIFGVEAYFVPSLEDWKELHRSQLAENAAAKAAKAASKKKKGSVIEEIGNELASTEAELEEIAEAKGGEETEDDSGGTIVENEEESKQKVRNPLYQRNHLVLLAKNDDGLKALFKMVSDSAADGFYRYPRMDLEMIRKYAKGNVVGLTACVAGYLAKIVFDHQEEGDFKLWEPNNNNFELIQRDLAQAIREFQDALGPENYYLELQFNKLGAQHLVNYHLIEASKRTGAPLVVTCDAHYSDPNHWREREIYKMMGRLQFMKPEDQRDELPASVDELKCELYPKNAEQIWASYKHYTEQTNAIGETMVCNVDGKPVYDDDLIREAIERTHDIAHQQIGKIEPDRRVKLPAIQRLLSDENVEQFKSKLSVEEADNEDSIAFQAVKQYAIEGLKNRKVAGKQAYIDRLKYELEVIKTLKFAKYFLTYYHIMRVCGEHMLLGNARGSAGGSLLAYVLGITQMDPIKHDLLFERFMTRKKRCLLPTTYILTNVGSCQLQYLDPSFHKVLTHTGEYKSVVSKVESEHSELIEVEAEDGTIITCSPNHLWVVVRDGQRVEVRADELRETDELIKLHFDERYAFEKL